MDTFGYGVLTGLIAGVVGALALALRCWYLEAQIDRENGRAAVLEQQLEDQRQRSPLATNRARTMWGD